MRLPSSTPGRLALLGALVWVVGFVLAAFLEDPARMLGGIASFAGLALLCVCGAILTMRDDRPRR